MTQFYIQSSSGGPLPPQVPLQFTVDFSSLGTPIGVVVPAGNNVNVFGNPNSPGTMGLITSAEQTLVPNDTIYVQYVNGRVTTNDNVPVYVNNSIITDNSSFTITAQVTAFDAVTGASFGGRCLVIGRNFAGVVEITEILENVSSGVAPLDDCSFYFEASGNELFFYVVGIPATTIVWHALIPQIATTP